VTVLLTGLAVVSPAVAEAKYKGFERGEALITPQELEGLMAAKDSKVVVYDEKYDATRLGWAFYLHGKTDVRILDGAYEGGMAAGDGTEMGTGADTDKSVSSCSISPAGPSFS